MTALKTLTLVGIPLLLAACARGELRPFTTDGCSLFPEGTPEQQVLWLGCCVEHDLAYWRGGTRDEREHADARLQQCVAGVGEPRVAELMLKGVRVGGSPYWPTPFRWGYGWPYGRGYRALTADEQAQVQRLVPKREAPPAEFF